MGRIDDGVDPEARGGVARIGLVFVRGADGFVNSFFCLSSTFLPSRSSCFQFISASVLAAASPLITAKRAVGHANMKRGS